MEKLESQVISTGNKKDGDITIQLQALNICGAINKYIDISRKDEMN